MISESKWESPHNCCCILSRAYKPLVELMPGRRLGYLFTGVRRSQLELQVTAPVPCKVRQCGRDPMSKGLGRRLHSNRRQTRARAPRFATLTFLTLHRLHRIADDWNMCANKYTDLHILHRIDHFAQN